MSATTTGDILLARLAEGLDSTAKLTQALLSDLRESEADFAAVKTELNILKENVKSLSLLIREGNGTTSLLTRVALIEQNIDNIKKWMDCHSDTHQSIKDEMSDVKFQLIEIERRLANVEGIVQQFVMAKADEDKAARASINREIELQHEKKKTDTQVIAERKAAVIKIIAALLIGLFGLLGGWATSQCSSNNHTNKTPSSISSNVP